MNFETKIKPKEAAEILDVHHSTVRRLINRKRLAAIEVLGTYLLDRAEVKRFAKKYNKYERG